MVSCPANPAQTRFKSWTVLYEQFDDRSTVCMPTCGQHRTFENRYQFVEASYRNETGIVRSRALSADVFSIFCFCNGCCEIAVGHTYWSVISGLSYRKIHGESTRQQLKSFLILGNICKTSQIFVVSFPLEVGQRHRLDLGSGMASPPGYHSNSTIKNKFRDCLRSHSFGVKVFLGSRSWASFFGFSRTIVTSYQSDCTTRTHCCHCNRWCNCTEI